MKYDNKKEVFLKLAYKTNFERAKRKCLQEMFTDMAWFDIHITSSIERKINDSKFTIPVKVANAFDISLD